jgi:UPF0755 protein
MPKFKKVVVFALAVALLVGVAVLFAAYRTNVILNEALDIPDEGVSFEIRPGAPFNAVSNELVAQGIVTRPEILRIYARLTGKASQVRAGEYRIEPGTTLKQLLEQFVAGDVELHAFAIIEGWTFREMLAALALHPAVEQSLVYEDWPGLLESLGADATHPEGLFLPETYRFPKYTKDAELLRQAYELLQQTLAEEWGDRAADLPIDSPYEALILASIVEKETARADERAKIAGVFARRLEKGMRLQTDPTVIYGIGVDFDGNLTRRDLRTDTPYNTYTRGGLPPTPIALAGRAAINAALHPAEGAELFFVATGLGDGSHKFSETKDQHDAAVREYLARERANRQNGQTR